MNIVVGINHPKQVHMFKNIIFELQKKGHSTYILLVDKDITDRLLRFYNLIFFKIGHNQKNPIKKLLNMVPLTFSSLAKIYKLKPDIFIGQAIPHLAYTSFLLHKPYIIFEDTENAKYPHLLANPFASAIVTPVFFLKDFGYKQIKINGSFEYAYLGKEWFTPDGTVLKKYGLSKNDLFSVIRFVSWTANHDIGHKGLSSENKVQAVKKFVNFGKVLISSELELPRQLEQYKIEIEPEDMHSLIYYARVVYGESASMAAEAGYLGTPSVFLDNDGRGYTDYLEKYNLVYNYTESLKDQENSIAKAVEILSSDNKNYWRNNAEKLNSDCIDVGAFMTWFIENYPQSKRVMQEQPDYQHRFR